VTTREDIIVLREEADKFATRQLSCEGEYHPDFHTVSDECFYTIAFEAGRVAEREECAKNAGEFARKWWAIHCATNRHLETTRAAHDDFCALQIAIRARGDTK